MGAGISSGLVSRGHVRPAGPAWTLVGQQVREPDYGLLVLRTWPGAPACHRPVVRRSAPVVSRLLASTGDHFSWDGQWRLAVGAAINLGPGCEREASRVAFGAVDVGHWTNLLAVGPLRAVRTRLRNPVRPYFENTLRHRLRVGAAAALDRTIPGSTRPRGPSHLPLWSPRPFRSR